MSQPKSKSRMICGLRIPIELNQNNSRWVYEICFRCQGSGSMTFNRKPGYSTYLCSKGKFKTINLSSNTVPMHYVWRIRI